MSKTGHLELDPEQLNFLWVTDFPLFEFDEEGWYLNSVFNEYRVCHEPLECGQSIIITATTL